MQKFMKIVVAFLLVLSIGLPSVTTSSSAAEQWTAYPANTTGDVNKAWKVTFSDVVNSSTVSQQNVYVKQANGQTVDVTPTVNGSTITVTPKAPYTVGETYTLYLHSSIQSVKEQALPNTTFQFTVLSALEIAKSVAQEAKIAAEAIKTGQPIFANPYAGTKDELTRANAFVADLEKAIAAAKEKYEAAKALIKTAENTGATVTELAGANANVKAAENAIKKAESAVLTAKQAIDTASISTQFSVAKVNVLSTSTVEVTLATAPAYELTKADADKFRVMMDGTLLLVTDVVKSSNNLEYTLTIATATTKYPLFGKQGILSVNNTRAVIPNSEFGYDFKAPTIDKVEVLDSRHVRVTFSENMGDSAATVGNYDIYKAKTTTPNLLSGEGAVAVLSVDRKSVTLTLGGTNALVAADYTLKLSGVKDVAGNNIRTNTTIDFPVTKDQLVDTTRPSLTAATYDSKYGVLTVTFDEKVTIASFSSFSLGGVKLTGSTGAASNEGTKHTIQVSNKEAVNEKLTNPLRLTIALGAVKDAASNNNSLTNYDLSVAIPPKAIQASYSEASKRLRVTFDQPIDMASVNPEEITVTVNSNDTKLKGGMITSTSNTPTLIIELTKDDSDKIKRSAGKAVEGTVTLGDGAVKNTANPQVANVSKSGIPLAYIEDTGKPRVEAITLTANENYNNDTIKVEFTKPMSQSSVEDASKYKLQGPGLNGAELTAENMVFETSSDKQKVIITLKKINLQYGEEYTLTVNNLMDAEGQVLDSETLSETVVGDGNPPIIKSVSAIAGDNEDIVTIVFSEAVKKDTAENIKNYTIESPGVTVSEDDKIIPSLTYSETATEFKVEIRYAKSKLTEILKPGGKVKVTVTGIEDLAGNKMEKSEQTSDVLDKIAPTVTEVQGKTVQNGLDEIIITFSENIDSASAKSSYTNYTLEVAGENVELKNLDSNDIIVQNNVVTLKLDTSNLKDGYDVNDYALKNYLEEKPNNDQLIKITVNGVEDKNNNAITAPNNVMEGFVNHGNNDTVASEFKDVASNAKVTGANTIQFTWDEELDLSTLNESDFKIIDTEVSYQIIKVDLDEETKKTVTLTTREPIEFNNKNLILSLTGEFTDLAGNAIPATKDKSVEVKELGTEAEYFLTAEKVADSVTSKYISLSTSTNKQISDLFKLKTGTPDNGEGFVVDTITLSVTTTAFELDELQLMWSDDAEIGNDIKISSPKQDVADGAIKFTGINKEISSGDEGYFYVLSKVSNPGTVTISLKEATAKASRTGVNIAAKKTPIEGTKITIDSEAPLATFESEGSSNNKIFVKIDEISSLARASSKTVLSDKTELSTIFEIVDVNGKVLNKPTIISAKYSDSPKRITIETSTGLPSNEFIRIKAGVLQDEAGNPLAATYIAQGNGTDKAFVNPYELNSELTYTGDINQKKLEEGNLTYGPYTSVAKKIIGNGNVNIIGPSAGVITLQNLDIAGDLTINTPNASVVIGANVTVGGTLIIEDISTTGLINNGKLGEVTITGIKETTFINNSNKSPDLAVNLSAPTNMTIFKLGGVINTVNVLKPAKLQVESGATITTLTVAANVEADITNNGVITTLAGDGTAIERAKKAGAYDGNIGENTAIQAIKDALNASAIGIVLEVYSSELGITNLSDYSALGSTYKTTVNTVIFNEKNSYANAGALVTAFNKVVATQKAFEAIKNARVAADLEKVFTDNSIALGIVLTEYTSLTNKTVVNQAIFTGRNSYATVAAFQTAFKNAVTIAEGNQQKDTELSTVQMSLVSVEDKKGSTSSNGIVTVTWNQLTAEQISTTGANSYEIYYAKGSSVTKETVGANSARGISVGNSSIDISGLENGEQYAFVIYAKNANNVYSVASDVTTGKALNHVAATAGTITGNRTYANVEAFNAALGDASTSPKILVLTVDGVDKTIRFNLNYTTNKFSSWAEVKTFVEGAGNLDGAATFIGVNGMGLNFTSVTTGPTSKVVVKEDDSSLMGESPNQIDGVAEAN